MSFIFGVSFIRGSTVYNMVPCFISVNSKSGRYLLSLALLAVFLYWPSDLLVSFYIMSYECLQA